VLACVACLAQALRGNASARAPMAAALTPALVKVSKTAWGAMCLASPWVGRAAWGLTVQCARPDGQGCVGHDASSNSQALRPKGLK